MYLVFEGLRLSLFLLNHLSTISSDLFILSVATSNVAPDVSIVVSSANLA